MRGKVVFGSAEPEKRPFRDGSEYYNDLVRDLDAHLSDSWTMAVHQGYTFGSCFWIDGAVAGYEYPHSPGKYLVAFRFPGATRGHIAIDRETGIITDVVFYETAYDPKGKVACYKESVTEVRDKWIGLAVPDIMEQIKNP